MILILLLIGRIQIVLSGIRHKKDVIPMWIADIDFKTAYPVINALEKRVSHGIFGYAAIPDAYYQAEVNWWAKRHNFKIKKE